MKPIIIALALLLVSGCVRQPTTSPAAASGQLVTYVEDTQANRLAAARRYAAAVKMAESMRETIRKMLPTLPADRRHDAEQLIESSDLMERYAVQVLSKHLSATELTALADFYSTPVGRSITNKMPETMADLFEEVGYIN